MQVVVLANGTQRTEFASPQTEGIIWISNEEDLLQYPSADAFVDLLYSNTERRRAVLAGLLPRAVIINSVGDTLQETHSSFVRINGWTTFLSSPVLEAACQQENKRAEAEAVFAFLHKKPEWMPDEPGFITPRVVSMIINEAYLALAEGVSTKEEIDTAMKLGTAYPYGPFEWAEKIGVQNIVALLQKLSKSQPRYTPAELLVQEARKTT